MINKQTDAATERTLRYFDSDDWDQIMEEMLSIVVRAVEQPSPVESLITELFARTSRLVVSSDLRSVATPDEAKPQSFVNVATLHLNDEERGEVRA